VFTVGLALVADTVDPKDIGYSMGYALSAMTCGVLLGPFFGSITFNIGGHFAVVALMGGIAIVDIILRLFMIEKTVAGKFELPKHACTDHTRLLSPPPPPLNDYHKTSKPSKPKWKTFALLSKPRVATALYGVFVHVVIIASFDAVLPIFLEQVFDWTSLNVALCFLAIALPDMLLGPLAGMISDTVGPMLPALFGCVLTAILMILLQLIDHNSSAQIWLLFVVLAFTGKTSFLLFTSNTPLRSFETEMLTKISFAGAASPLIISPLAADLFYAVDTLVRIPFHYPLSPSPLFPSIPLPKHGKKVNISPSGNIQRRITLRTILQPLYLRHGSRHPDRTASQRISQREIRLDSPVLDLRNPHLIWCHSHRKSA
jgi:hypothetical protein